jgi:hypothetical protein
VINWNWIVFPSASGFFLVIQLLTLTVVVAWSVYWRTIFGNVICVYFQPSPVYCPTTSNWHLSVCKLWGNYMRDLS